jgi:hypothetical protein
MKTFNVILSIANKVTIEAEDGDSAAEFVEFNHVNLFPSPIFHHTSSIQRTSCLFKFKFLRLLPITFIVRLINDEFNYLIRIVDISL